MRKQAAAVLGYLIMNCSDTDTNIGLWLGIPAASVRRSIQELIAHGHNVTYASHSGLYTYSTPQQTGV